MRVLVTGHQGYIGSVLVPLLESHGHELVGLDVGWFADCTMVAAGEPPSAWRVDVRDVRPEHFEHVDAVVHLAGLSNDPLGDLDPAMTHFINTEGTARVIHAAREAGVGHIVLASSCSVYGTGSVDALLNENTPPAPLTAYARSKVAAEAIVLDAATDTLRTTVLRGATVYGSSPRLRLDLVVNELVAMAVAQGVVELRSTGTAWRPFVHVADFCAAFAAVLEAAPDGLHYGCYNVGSDTENHRIVDLATTVAKYTGVEVAVADDAGSDARNYRVSFERLTADLPDFGPRWTVLAGIDQLVRMFQTAAFDADGLVGDRYRRLPRLRRLMHEGIVDDDLRYLPRVGTQ
jgi:nucleoside-diphosphate-sugar epimerase